MGSMQHLRPADLARATSDLADQVAEFNRPDSLIHDDPAALQEQAIDSACDSVGRAFGIAELGDDERADLRVLLGLLVEAVVEQDHRRLYQYAARHAQNARA